jgi:hypothetical protein
LEAAVASAISSGTTGFTPAALAQAALEPYPISQVTPAPKVRADRETTAGGVAAAAIGALITEGTDTSFSTDVGAITSDLVTVNAGNKLEDLTAAGQTAVVNDAIGKIDAAYAAGTSQYSASTLISADEAIGETASQAEVSTELAKLNPTKASTINIETATSAQIVAAVDALVLSNTNPAVNPATLATSVYIPYPPLTSGSAVRTDRATSAPAVVTGVITTLLTSTYTASDFEADAGAVTDAVAVINGTNAKTNLTIAAREAVVKAALGVLSNAYAGLATKNYSQANILAADEAIGADLSGDATLQALTSSGLTTLLQTAITGVTGTKGTATAAAPYAAESFVQGILTNGVPNSGSAVNLSTFGVAILKSVSTNTSVDELVSYQVALQETDASDVASLGEVLLAKYPKAQAKITQGILASVSTTASSGTNAQGNDSTGRVAVLDAMATKLPTDAVAIAQGGVFDDPLHSPQYTSGVFDGIVASSSTKGHTTLVTDAPAIATGVGSILGADGDVLTNVATTFATYVTNGDLPITAVPTYASDLINGAIKGVTPVSQFSSVSSINTGLTTSIAGGALVVNANSGVKGASPATPAETVVDLESIEDQFAEAIINSESGFGNATVAKSIATELGLLAEDVAKVTKNYNVVGGSTPVATFLAGSLVEYIASVTGQTNATFVAEAEAAIEKDIELAAGNSAAIKTAVGNAVAAAENSTTAYTIYGAISIDETPVTNL